MHTLNALLLYYIIAVVILKCCYLYVRNHYYVVLSIQLCKLNAYKNYFRIIVGNRNSTVVKNTVSDDHLMSLSKKQNQMKFTTESLVEVINMIGIVSSNEWVSRGNLE